MRLCDGVVVMDWRWASKVRCPVAFCPGIYYRTVRVSVLDGCSLCADDNAKKSGATVRNLTKFGCRDDQALELCVSQDETRSQYVFIALCDVLTYRARRDRGIRRSAYQP